MESLIRKHPVIQLTSKAKEWMVFGISLICMFLFLYTAYSKLADYKTFKNGLKGLVFFGSYADYLAWLIPVGEIIISLLMIIPKTYTLGLWAFTGLMILFTGYIASMMVLGQKLPCYCGGVIENLGWMEHVWFNIGFIGLSVYALWLGKAKINI